jgi:hypothetical protein
MLKTHVELEYSIGRRNDIVHQISEILSSDPQAIVSVSMRTNEHTALPLSVCQDKLFTAYARTNTQTVAIDVPPIGYIEHFTRHYADKNQPAILFVPYMTTKPSKSLVAKIQDNAPVIFADSYSTPVAYVKWSLSKLPEQSLANTRVELNQIIGKKGNMPGKLPVHIQSIYVIPSFVSKGSTFTTPIFEDTTQTSRYSATYTIKGNGHERAYHTIRTALQSPAFRGYTLQSSQNAVTRKRKIHTQKTHPDTFSVFSTDSYTQFSMDFDVFSQASNTIDFILSKQVCQPVTNTSAKKRPRIYTLQTFFEMEEQQRAQATKNTQQLPHAHHGVVDDKLSEFMRIAKK